MRQDRRWTHWVLCAAAGTFALTACTPSVTTTRFRELAPLNADVEVRLYSARLPQCPYDEVGLVSSKRPNPWTSMEEVLEALVVRAREMGGDAIVGLRETPPSSGQAIVLVGSDGVVGSDGSGSSRTLSGTVIRFTDPSCRQ